MLSETRTEFASTCEIRPSYTTKASPRPEIVSWSQSAPAMSSLDTFGVRVGGLPLRIPPGIWDSDDIQSSSLTAHTFCARQAPRALKCLLSTSFDHGHADSFDSTLIASSRSRDSSVEADFGVTDQVLTGSYLFDITFLGTLGCGGYGKVLLAESLTDPSRLSAVKVFAKKSMSRADAQEVQTEVDVLRRIWNDGSQATSAFTQKIRAAFQTKAHVFIVMDRHCASLSHPALRSQLRLRLGTGSPSVIWSESLPNSVSLPIAFPSCSTISTPYEEALHTLRLLTAEVILGLFFLHSLGIVHQDIKPANLLVSADGHLVITDFGSARFRPLVSHSDLPVAQDFDFASNAAWQLNQGGTPGFGSIVLHADDQVSYTRRYAAPELLRAPPDMDGQDILVYDERVDYYSLGVTLRELALGDAPDDTQDRWECASDGAKRQDSPTIVGNHLSSFIDVLTAQTPDDRLHGAEVKHQPFFVPIEELWDDIAALRIPPFPEVFWAEINPDTRWDLRTYAGEDSQDSLVGRAGTWVTELANIPYDIGSIRKSNSSPLCRSIRGREAEGFGPVLSAINSACSSLGPLSHLPTIPSLESDFSPPWLAEEAVSCPPNHRTVSPVPECKTPLLRRRQFVYGLRQAFRGVDARTAELLPPRPSDYAAERSGVPSKTVGGCVQWKSPPTLSTHEPSVVQQWSFEHQITIALLARMTCKGASATPMPGRGCVAGVHCPEQNVSKKAKVQSPGYILRKMRTLMSWV